MIYTLDTNTCIRYLNGRAPGILAKLQTLDPQDIAICSIVRAELFYGARKSNNPTRTLSQQQLFLGQFPTLPFDDRCADVYGQIRAHLSSLGTPIGPNDLLIAAIALANNLVLVTHNTREFSRIPGIRLEDWEI